MSRGLTTVPAAGTRVVLLEGRSKGRVGTVIREVRQRTPADSLVVVVRFDTLKCDQNIWVGFLGLAPFEEPDTAVEGLDKP